MIAEYPFDEFKLQFSAVGCIVKVGSNILLLLRNKEKPHGGLWGLPAGKVESVDEKLHDSMARELFQETGIDAEPDDLKYLRKYYVRYPEEYDFIFHLFIYEVDFVIDVIINPQEHSNYIWLPFDKALSLSLVPDLDSCLSVLFSINNTLNLFPNFSTKMLRQQVEEKVRVDFLSNAKLSRNNRQNSLNGPVTAYGMPASGKTTTLLMMYSHFLKKYGKNDCPKYVSESRILFPGTPLNKYLSNMFLDKKQPEASFHFQMTVLQCRFYRSYFSDKRDLLDEGLYSALAYAKTLYNLEWLTDEEYSVIYESFLNLNAVLPPPSYFIYFYAPYDEIKRRMKERGRTIEKEYDDRYMNNLFESFEETYCEIVGRVNTIKIDTTDKSQEDVLNSVLSYCSGNYL